MGSASCTLGNYYYWVGLCISIISSVYMSSPVVGQFCSLLSYCFGHLVTATYFLMVLVYLFFISLHLPLLYPSDLS